MTKSTPMFLFHASKDDTSLASLLLKTVAKLHELNYTYSLKIYDSSDHNLTDKEKEVDRDVIEWLDKYLKK